MDSTTPSPPQVSPSVPWQVRWKRPQFNKVVLGIEDTSDCNNTPSSNNIKNSNNNNDEYEELNVDEINKQWTSISNSSIVLTRKEAQTVITELSKRDKLLIRCRKRNGTHDVNNNLSSSNDDKSRVDYISSNSEKVTPKNKNTKSSVNRRAVAGTTLPVNNDKTSKTTSMSNWFKSITSPSNTNNNNNSTTISLGGKPPRAKTPTTTFDTTTTQQKQQSQLSPTGKTFTTFNVKTPPPNPLPNFADSSQQSNMYDSPPDDNDDCQVSTASSLLWEDMTLTSVSEEDALHYHGGRRLRGRETVTATEQQQRLQQVDVKDDGSTDSSKRRLFNSNAELKPTRDELGGGRYYYDRHGNLRLSDWDGYDNIVLSTTIYSTGSCSTSDDRRGTSSGEVVVMEILSTKNPPSSNSKSKTEGAATSTTAKNKGGKKKVVEEHLKLSSSDSSSHASSPTSTKGEQSKTISSDDVSTNSTSTTTNNTARQYSDEEEEEGTSNHTRILTRRVLYWPTYINNDKHKLNDCPSFVSLGRTNIWKNRKSHEIDEPLASARVEEEEEEQDVRSQPQESGNTLLGNICGPLFDNDESDEAEESSDSEEQAEKKKDEQNDTSPESSIEERAADAMEVYRSLNFLFGGSSDTLPSKKGTSSKSTQKTRKIDVAPRHYPIPIKKKKKLTQPLSICLVTSNGTVHFFHALRVLLSGNKSSSSKRSSKNDSEDLSNSFASLFMGSNLFTKVNDSVMPLSHPHATMQLSQLVPSSGSRKEEEKARHDDDPSIWHKFLLQQQEAKEPNEQTSSRGNDWSSLGTFDASIDPTTLPLRTIRLSNIITGSCVTSDTNNSYLAVCGKGLRRIVHNSKDDNNRRRTSHALGGYVTFISLRHNTESRTVYVPFAPDSIQPIYWMGMHFVVLLGEEGRVTEGGLGRQQQRRPYSMAIRVDCSHESQLSSHSSSIPSRFQCISIALPSISESLGVLHLSQLLTASGSLPQLDCVETRAVAVSSIPSSPPGIILSFRIGSKLVVVNHTLLPFQAEGVGRKQITLPTLVRPGHRALLNVGHSGKIASNHGNVWCLGGQGWSLLGIQGGQKSHFICWDGATDDTQGPYILPFNDLLMNEKRCLSSVVTPLMSYVKYAEKVAESSHFKAVADQPNTSTKSSFRLPSFLQQNEAEGDFSSAGFTMPKRSLSSTLKESIKLAAIIEGGVDEILINALDSISSLKHKSPKSSGIGGSRSNRTKSLAMSHQEKSKRLLRQCSSWTQLDDTKANRGIVHGQGKA